MIVTKLTVFLLSFSVMTGESEDGLESLLHAVERLSTTTSVGGGGPDHYAQSLCPEFTRWTSGSTVVNDRRDWVAGVRGWWDEGWRVSSRQTLWQDIRFENGFAFVRRNVLEQYSGPGGETSRSAAALAEVWMYESSNWCLLHVSAEPQSAAAIENE
jgi:hypothetical protein